MKRAPELTELSREHHQSLRLAKRCLDTLDGHDPARIEALCREIADDFDHTWERHFAHEEAAIFSVTEEMPGRIHELGEQLVAEHQRMREMARRMRRGDCSVLGAFGELLRDHTRLEERELFPLVEAQFSAEQKARIAELTGVNGTP